MEHFEKYFLSCDWGTSSFRLRLVAVLAKHQETAGLPRFCVLAEVENDQGNARVYEAWQQSGRPREAWYALVLEEALRQLKSKSETQPEALPLVISGMASSTIGMKELPYKPLPFRLDGSDLLIQQLERKTAFANPVYLISGVAGPADVMRGEEVQVVGSCAAQPLSEGLIIHPGTHAKHILVKDGLAVSFKTFMTGELFALLSQKSILAASVAAPEQRGLVSNSFFEKGLRDGFDGSLLHQLFMVRTADLFRQRSKEENYLYLSGLLIGSELTAFPKDFQCPVLVAGAPGLTAQYVHALRFLQLGGEQIIEQDADDITVLGQYLALHHFLNQKQ